MGSVWEGVEPRGGAWELGGAALAWAVLANGRGRRAHPLPLPLPPTRKSAAAYRAATHAAAMPAGRLARRLLVREACAVLARLVVREACAVCDAALKNSTKSRKPASVVHPRRPLAIFHVGAARAVASRKCEGAPGPPPRAPLPAA